MDINPIQLSGTKTQGENEDLKELFWEQNGCKKWHLELQTIAIVY